MTDRLTDTIVGLVSSDQIERLGATLGASPGAAAQTLRQATGALVSGLADLATLAGGTTRVDEILSRGGITALERLDDALERGADPDGAELADAILGERSRAVAAEIESADGSVDAGAGRRALGTGRARRRLCAGTPSARQRAERGEASELC